MMASANSDIMSLAELQGPIESMGVCKHASLLQLCLFSEYALSSAVT